MRIARVLAVLVLAAASMGGTPAAPAPTGAIRVVIDENYPPYSFRDSNGELRGIRKDMWDLWQARTGIRVELTPLPWGRALDAMAAGEADVIDLIFDTPERRPHFSFSEPYATIEVRLYFDAAIGGINDAASAKGFTVGVKNGDACVEFLLHQGITDLKAYADYDDLVQAAARQDVRVLCIDQPAAQYFMIRRGVAGRFRSTPPLFVGRFHWAVANGRDALLRTVATGFARIEPRERELIERNWLGIELGGALWPGFARYGLPALGTLGLAVVLLFGWTWALRRRVAARTRELSATLDSLGGSERRLRTLFEQANDAILILRGAAVLDCNRRAEDLYGLPRERIVGATLMQGAPPLQPDGRDSKETLQGALAMALQGRPAVFEWRHHHASGAALDVEINLSRLEGDGGGDLLAIVRDITERKRAQDEIARLAYFDPLTQLPNRRMLQERLRQDLSACARREHGGALLFIDLDNFKLLNDTRGHAVGDRLLQEVARRLRARLRCEDFIARLGGDEFVVLLEDLPAASTEAAAQAEAVAHKLIAAVAEPYELDGQEHHTTTSVGLCLFDGAEGETAEEVLRRADAAMYRAKTAGRNTLGFFDPAMQRGLELRSELEAQLRRALPQQQLQLYFQPQVDRERRVVGCEALLRWLHPERGLVPPGQFIALAEETGLILPIGHWVLETACACLRDWAATPGMEQLGVAVNVSARQFRHPNFVAEVAGIVRAAGVPPRQLTLELTESMVLDNVAESIEKMHALAQLGIQLAMDDFGTGYSSLSYLKRLPLHELKIDQSFVRDIASDASDEVIVRTIIAMAQNLGLVVVAEGVETEVQWEFLLRHNCQRFQGYLFAQPRPREEFQRTVLQGLAAQ